MSKRKATQKEDDSMNSDDLDASNRRSMLSQTVDRKSLAFSEKRKKISNTYNELTQYGDFSTNEHGTQRKSIASIQQRVGIIENISLTNFKCHSFLEFSFHSYINFILGRNGSKLKKTSLL